MFMDLSQKNILVVGAGKIALRRVIGLLPFVENKGITVVAPTCMEEFYKLEIEGQIVLLQEKFDKIYLEEKDIVIVATSNHLLNKKIYDDCKKQGILVNVASDKNLCDFYFPGIVCKDEVVIGITANGKDHKKAKACRSYIANCMEDFK